jgi:tetratricopeptide (TPR) repeat protein
MWNLAEVLRGLGRFDEAETLVRRTLEMWEARFGPEHEWTAWGLICLAEVRLAQGDAEEAIGAAERAARVIERLFGKAHAVLGSTLDLHGRALLRAGRPADAQSVLASALEVHASLGAAGDAAAQATRALLDECRAGIGESEKRSLSAPA